MTTLPLKLLPKIVGRTFPHNFRFTHNTTFFDANKLSSMVITVQNKLNEANDFLNAKNTPGRMKKAHDLFSETLLIANEIEEKAATLNPSQEKIISLFYAAYGKYLLTFSASTQLDKVDLFLEKSLRLDPENQEARHCLAERNYTFGPPRPKLF